MRNRWHTRSAEHKRRWYAGRKRQYATSREYRLRQQIANGALHALEWVERAAALCEAFQCEPELFWAYRRHLRHRNKLTKHLASLIAANMEKYHAAKMA